MRFAIFLFSFSISAHAQMLGNCPNISGQYWCHDVNSNGLYETWAPSKTAAGEIQYSANWKIDDDIYAFGVVTDGATHQWPDYSEGIEISNRKYSATCAVDSEGSWNLFIDETGDYLDQLGHQSKMQAHTIYKQRPHEEEYPAIYSAMTGTKTFPDGTVTPVNPWNLTCEPESGVRGKRLAH